MTGIPGHPGNGRPGMKTLAGSTYLGTGWTSCREVLMAGVEDSDSCDDSVD